MAGSRYPSAAGSEPVDPLAWLRQENQRLQAENAALMTALAAAAERYAAIAAELQAASAQLASERDSHAEAETASKALIEAISRQKTDLEVLVQTLTEHGDSLDAHWQQKFHEASLQAGIDSLTQIPNRRRFDEYFECQWQQLAQERAWLSLLMLDVDAFKAYNDTYGHLAGDACLQQIATAINQCLQHPEDFAARYGGEEFVAVLPRTDLEAAILVARRIQIAVRRLKIQHKNSPVRQIVTVSIGLASWVPEAAAAPRNLIQLADERLYQAKQQGRNCIVSTS